ncbi:MAG: aminotransferase class V-fold PLP-dependent enzyme, partial [Bacteroidales bacterium]|nr:aminotransferase class V-fold PLP-dependent enzyme [Bacteroidales bacterium]
KAKDKMLDNSVKMVSVAHISNVLGLKNPVKKIIAAAHKCGAAVMIDGAQGILHAKVDVKELDCDFYAFSGHKIYAPTGIGILYGKRDWLEKLPVYMGGGDMVDRVSFSKTTYAPLPLRFEAGTPNFMAAAALTPALEFAQQMAQDVEVEAHEKALIAAMEALLCSIDGLKIAGGLSKETNGARVPLFSFSIDGVHPEDAALILDKMGVAVRSGLMCAEPIVRKYSDNGLLRVSMLPYNSLEEVEIFGTALKKVIKMLR